MHSFKSSMPRVGKLIVRHGLHGSIGLQDALTPVNRVALIVPALTSVLLRQTRTTASPQYQAEHPSISVANIVTRHNLFIAVARDGRSGHNAVELERQLKR